MLKHRIRQANYFSRILVCGFVSLFLQVPAVTLAQSMGADASAVDEDEKRDTAALIEEWQGPTLRTRARIFASFESIEKPDLTSANSRQSDTYFRRADITIRGSLTKKLDYRLKTEFRDGELDIRDAYFSYDAGLVTVLAGLLDPLDELMTPAYREYNEVSTVEGFPPNNQLGIGLLHEAEYWTFYVAALKHTIDKRHFEKTGTVYSTRFTIAPPVPEGYLLHIGAYASSRKADNDEGLFSYSARSVLRTGQRLVDTGEVADKEQLFGVELAGSIGSVSLESQCAVIRASLPSALESNSYLNGCYLAGIWNITGEMRNYSNGGFSLINVDRSVFEGGPGTWQIGLRHEIIDLSDGAIQGGRQDTSVFALNWYLSNQFWISGNYSRAKFNNNAYRGEEVEGLGFRLQYLVEW
jgi:phosphate-selective porin OprO/OprP